MCSKGFDVRDSLGMHNFKSQNLLGASLTPSSSLLRHRQIFDRLKGLSGNVESTSESANKAE